VTSALLVAALAMLAWPSGRRTGSRRLVAAAPGGGSRLRWSSAVPRAPVASGGAVVIGSLLATPLVALLAGVVVLLAVRALLAGRRSGHGDEQVQALTEGLAALAAELRSGRSLEEAAVAATAACGDADTGRSLALALRSSGTPPEETDAVVAEALQRITAGVLLSSRTGCSLAAVAGAVEDDLRARRRHREELRAAIAAPRASAMLLAGLPVLGLLMGSGIGADPWGVLTTTGVGQLLLVLGVGLEVAGVAWSGRLVRRALR
jgi:tight adherence protein B